MKFLAACVVAVASLGGCADPACVSSANGISVYTCSTHPNYGPVVASGEPLTARGKELKARDDEERRRMAEEAQRVAAEEKTEAERVAHDQGERAEAELRARVQSDEARGYKHVPFGDLYLDYKSLPLASKRAVSNAFYQRHGEGYETLTSLPGPGFSEGLIVLLTDGSPREVRAKLLARPYQFGTFLGHTTRCVITSFGLPREDVCFAIDEIW